MKLKRFSDLSKVLKKDDECITIDLSDASMKEHLRIIDFLCGLTYFNGHLNKLERNIYQVILK